jgi:hypothetical protein
VGRTKRLSPQPSESRSWPETCIVSSPDATGPPAGATSTISSPGHKADPPVSTICSSSAGIITP